ncbi:hypothetical protein P280DRAFT_465013 [Massarina eburnea CBS 473.64]|uniref:DUF4470 domain-containing protein n=1 Tax=Massarina eburnea CBS 473.64 TaxID=1395130 RepID=A0A6A6SHM5_9PLEO|nr:hypothetical protein P280DRAFT_465013 [Massarina eburnea CBS 473.64]
MMVCATFDSPRFTKSSSLFRNALVSNTTSFVMANLSRSEEARQKGNESFAKRDFRTALTWYKKSENHNPNDYRAPWNTSAVYFELGQYISVIDNTAKVLGFSLASEVKHKVLVRKAKSHLYLCQLDDAKRTIDEMSECDEKTLLASAIQSSLILRSSHDEHQRINGPGHGIRSLPHYKAQIDSVLQYIGYRHDSAQSMIDVLLSHNVEDSGQISLLLGGIGDARHFFQTLRIIYTLSFQQAPERNYHFTINDLKPEVLARDMIFFILIDQLATALPLGQKSMDPSTVPTVPTVRQTLITLFYTYTGQVMPPTTFDHLQKTIQLAIDGLNGKAPLPRWIRLNTRDAGPIVSALCSWRDEVPLSHAVPDFIEITKRIHAQKDMAFTTRGGRPMEERVAEHLKIECRDYSQSCLLLPPKYGMDPELKKLLDLPHSQSRSSQLRTYIEENWKINPTLIDVNYVKQGSNLSEIGHQPFEFERQMYDRCVWLRPKDPKILFDYAVPFFTHAARAVSAVGGRLVVEVLTGDITRVLEGIDKNLLHERDPSFPTKYDRIHLSNIPDYVGGSLFNCIYALPLLKDKPSSFASSMCLRNPQLFSSQAAYDNEYTTLPSESSIKNILKVETKLMSTKEDALMKTFQEPPARLPFAAMEYFAFLPAAQNLHLQDMASRATLEKWLYQVFIKIALPAQQPVSDPNHPDLVFAPLNLTAFFRILEITHRNGYPAHWLADLLTTILSNRVQTTARPPRTCPLSISESQKNFPPKFTDLSPFMAEIRTLAALWLGEDIGFGLASAVLLPTPSKIRSFSIRFSDVGKHGVIKTPVFTLLFADRKCLDGILAPPSGSDGAYNIRKSLLSDEKKEKGNVPEAFRKNSAVVTTWKWEMKESMGTFWMDEQVVEMWMKDDWVVSILRQDEWKLCVPPMNVLDAVVGGEYWVREG